MSTTHGAGALLLVALLVAGCTGPDAPDPQGPRHPPDDPDPATSGPAAPPGSGNASALQAELKMPDGLAPWGFILEARFVTNATCDTSWSASGAFDDHPAHLVSIQADPGFIGSTTVAAGQAGHSQGVRLEVLPSGILGWTASGAGTLAGGPGETAWWLVGLAGGTDDDAPQSFTAEISCDAGANATLRTGTPILVVPGGLSEGDAVSASSGAGPVGHGNESVSLRAEEGLVVGTDGIARRDDQAVTVRLAGDPGDTWMLGDDAALWHRGAGTFLLSTEFLNADPETLHGVALRIAP